MSTIAIQRQSNIFNRSQFTGTSDASQKLQKIYDNTVISLRKAVTWNRIGNTLDSLKEVFSECYETNWDGYGAQPITVATYQEAIRFLNSIPSWLEIPEIVPEPSGDIGFEWNFGKNKIFAVSLNGTNKLVYAGILGAGNKAHGIEVFNGALPRTIIDNVLRISPVKEES